MTAKQQVREAIENMPGDSHIYFEAIDDVMREIDSIIHSVIGEDIPRDSDEVNELTMWQTAQNQLRQEQRTRWG